jgi:hypothetical protein
MNLLEKAKVITTPTAYSDGKLHSVKPEIVLGPELVTNGDFATDSDWAKGTGWTISGGTANCDGTNSSILRQNNLIPLNTKVKVSFTVTNYTSGSIIVKFAPTSYSVSLSGNGIYTVITDGDNTVNGDLQLLSNSFIGSIDNVSVKEDISADFDFTRGSSATRVNEAGLIESVAANLPRINYENGIGHLLLEPQRTNLITYSESFSNAYWSKTRCTINQNSIISPSGLLNASLLTATDTSENYIQSDVSTAVSGTKQVISCFVKKGTSDFTHLLLWDTSANGARQWFDLENGIIGTSTSFGSGISVDSASIEEYVNGWYRCIVVFNNSITPVRFRISASNGDGDFNSSIGKTIYIWGYQLEVGSYPTSYIPTSGSATTRLAETCTNAGNSDIIPSDEGVLYAEIAALANDGTFRLIGVSDGTSTNRIYVGYKNLSNQIQCAVSVGGVDQSLMFDTISDVQSFVKVAIKYKTNDFALWINGVEVLTDTSGITFPANTLNTATFSSGAGSSIFYGKTRMVAVFPYLSNDELECLTGEGYGSFEAMALANNYTIIQG